MAWLRLPSDDDNVDGMRSSLENTRLSADDTVPGLMIYLQRTFRRSPMLLPTLHTLSRTSLTPR